MFQLIDQGGAFVWVMIALAFVGMVIVLERVLFFQRTRINVGDLLLGLANHVRKKEYAEATHEAARAPGPVARVSHSALMRYNLPRADLRDIAQEAGQLEVPRIEKRLRGLYGIALVAPLVGMLGTVSGLIETFSLMSQQNEVSTTVEMTKGIYRSLITTAMGLMIAVPAYLFYLYFLGRTKRLIHRIERAGIEIVNIICDARGDSEILSFREKAAATKATEKATEQSADKKKS